MNVSGFVSECSDLLDDPKNTLYPIATLIRAGDRQLRGLFRTLTETNSEYSNFSMCIQKEAATKVFDATWEYRLPTWIVNVVGVYYRLNEATSESTFSPYKWTTLGTAAKGNKIPKHAAVGLPHWSWQGNHTLRLEKFTTAQELVIEVAARPPKMVKGKIATANTSQSAFYMPPTPSFGELEIEEGAYINAEFQVTSTSNVNATQYGDIRRCIYSNASTIVSSTRYHELTMDAAWTATLAVDDVIESVLAIPDEHTRLLVLRVGMACAQKRNNTALMKAIMTEMPSEEQKFKDYATPPRDKGGPTFIKRNLNERPTYDKERPFSAYGYWY